MDDKTIQQATDDTVKDIISVGETEEIWCLPRKELINHFYLLLVLKDNVKNPPGNIVSKRQGVEFTPLWTTVSGFKELKAEIEAWGFKSVFPVIPVKSAN